MGGGWKLEMRSELVKFLKRHKRNKKGQELGPWGKGRIGTQRTLTKPLGTMAEGYLRQKMPKRVYAQIPGDKRERKKQPTKRRLPNLCLHRKGAGKKGI